MKNFDDLDLSVLDSGLPHEKLEIDIYSDIISKIYAQNLTERQIAEKTGHKQPEVHRLLSAKHSPRLVSICKLIEPFGYTLKMVKKDSEAIDNCKASILDVLVDVLEDYISLLETSDDHFGRSDERYEELTELDEKLRSINELPNKFKFKISIKDFSNIEHTAEKQADGCYVVMSNGLSFRYNYEDVRKFLDIGTWVRI